MTLAIGRLAGILLLLHFVSPANGVCNVVGYAEAVDGKCYKVYQVEANFVDAEKKCTADNAHLVSVHSKAEDDIAKSLLTAGHYALVGIRCTTEAACTWSDGSAYDYNAFIGGKPIIAYGSCALLSGDSGNWQSANCDSKAAAFVCRLNPQQPAGPCDAGWTAYGAECARASTTTATAAAAEAACAESGGHLAAIHSDQDNSFYNKLLQDAGINTNTYIGLGLADGGAYRWNDGSDYDFKKFAAGFPNANFGRCVRMLRTDDLGEIGEWANVQCSSALPYVCARPGGGGPTLAPPVCPKLQTFNDNGTVYSPGFPVSFEAGLKCSYFLTVRPGELVAVHFPEFAVDTGTSLSLFDGEAGALIAKLSQNVDPTMVYTTSVSNIMRMVFVSSAVPVGRGWRAVFETVAGTQTTTQEPYTPNTCPSQLYYNANITLHSPGWPGQYGSMLNCTYIVSSASASSNLTVIFGEVDTEECCDVVTVYDGMTTSAPVLGRVSGRLPAGARVLVSTQSHVTLTFITDSNVQYNGWTADAIDYYGPKSGCDPKWTFSESDQRCYRVFDEPAADFAAAAAACTAQGAQLVSIHSKLQNDIIYDLASQVLGATYRLAYIGVRKSADGLVSWSDGTPFDYSNWLEPPLSTQKSAAFMSYHGSSQNWVGVEESSPLAYICYRKA